MDQNKLNKLQEIGYTIPRSCGTCKHFTQYEDMHFGECAVNEYTHLKHTGGKRKLSVVQYGSCNKYEQGEVGFLHAFTMFLTSSNG
jgi:hypothetical protein